MVGMLDFADRCLATMPATSPRRWRQGCGLTEPSDIVLELRQRIGGLACSAFMAGLWAGAIGSWLYRRTTCPRYSTLLDGRADQAQPEIAPRRCGAPDADPAFLAPWAALLVL